MAFARKINYLLARPSLIKSMGQNAIKVAKEHDIDFCAKELEKIYLSFS